ncbi:Hypothetical predicted protein, partial [Mytilus galloprovincialis]
MIKRYSKRKTAYRVHQGFSIQMDIENLDEGLKNNKSFKAHLGGNLYCILEEDSVCVNIRQFRKTPDDDVVPTKRGLTLRQREYEVFRATLDKLENLVPELDQTLSCVLTHEDREGLIQCS